MAPTVIRASEPRELLSYVPYALGFRPAESVVALSLRGTPGRIGAVLRMDIGDLARDRTGTQAAERLSRAMHQDGATRVLLVVYTAALRADVGGSVGAAGVAVRRARKALDGRLLEVWHVSPRGYAALDCDDPDCCPPAGRPLAELDATQVSAHMVVEGAQVRPQREDLAVARVGDARARRSAARAASRQRARLERVRALPETDRAGAHALVLGRALDRWCRLRDRAGAGQSLAPGDLGRLAADLADVLVRDAHILSVVEECAAPSSADPCCADPYCVDPYCVDAYCADPSCAGPDCGDLDCAGPDCGDLDCAGADCAGSCCATTDHLRGRGPGGLVPLVLGPDARRPEPDRTRPALQVLEAAAAHVPGPRAAPALTTLAWLCWWEGDGARAGVVLDQALAVDAEYSLARVLHEVVAAGVAPGWVDAMR